MASSRDLLRPGEFRDRMGVSNAHFHRLQARGEFIHLKNIAVSRARRTTLYCRARVEQWLADGQPAPVVSTKPTAPRLVSSRGPKLRKSA